MKKEPIIVIGAGLAGSEAAFQIASRKIPVELYEMRPKRMTEAHTGQGFCELVCSNSFGSLTDHSASKILKDEITRLGSFVLRQAFETQVPAGSSLAVDREKLSENVTQSLSTHPYIEVIREELTQIPLDRTVVMATGPLTSKDLSLDLAKILGDNSLYFYDAISPIVSADSLDYSKMFFANRYDKGETQDFLNIPLSKEQYETLVDDLLNGEVVLPHDFEEEKYFEGCMPVEAIAARGRQTLAFGPLRPVGLNNPKTGKRAYAVIQLRTENVHKTAYNLVGFQTKLKYKEQERVFRKLPGLENAEFLRLGSMHRNTYINSPKHLLPTLQLKKLESLFIAGQLTGTEGYLESVSTGLLAGINAARLYEGKVPLTLPASTMLGALTHAISDSSRTQFQPMNSNIGVLPPLDVPVKKDKKLRNQKMSERSQESLISFLAGITEKPMPQMENYTELRG